MEENERDEIENDQVTQAPLKIAKDPGKPTPEEVAEHDPTHIPYRSWCPVCVEASGKEDGHFSRKDDGDGRSVAVFDHKSFGQEEKEDDSVTALVLRDKSTRTMFAHICTQKGAADTWVMKKVLEDLDYLGHVGVILKCEWSGRARCTRVHGTAPPAENCVGTKNWRQGGIGLARYGIHQRTFHDAAEQISGGHRWKDPVQKTDGQTVQGPCDRIWRASTGKTNETKANTAESVAEVQVG